MQLSAGTYQGDGSDNRPINYPGFQPDVVIIKGNLNESAYIRTSTMTGDVSKSLVDDFVFQPDIIQSFTTDGFVVGGDDIVNGNGVDYYWIAFKAEAGEMVVGSYTGDDTDNRSINSIGFQPGYVIVMSEADKRAMQRFSSEPINQSMQFNNDNEKANRIQDFEADGFQIGDHNTVNNSGVIYHYIAWNSVPGRIADNWYNGDGNDNRDITDVGFQPEYIIIANEGNINSVHRPSSLTADSTLFFNSAFNLDDGIQAFLADGFQVGSLNEVNQNSTKIYWVAFNDVDTITTYFVSPAGDDVNSGLDSANAWVSLDNGDQLSILNPGDTINIYPGVYSVSTTVQLTLSGTQALPIVYRKFGAGTAIIDPDGSDTCAIQVLGNNIQLLNLEIINPGRDGILLIGDSCLITGCCIHDCGLQGIDIEGNDNLILRNVFYNANQSGIVNRNGSENNLFYGNTIYSCPLDGIWIDNSVSSARVFNNIIIGGDDGIDGTAGNICGYNDIWNSGTNDYSGGVVDSAGGISDDPQFVNQSTYNFHLREGSPAIDAGLDLGYPYNDAAPDMGAIEYSTHVPINFYVSPTGDDGNSGLDSANAWASLDNGDQLGILQPGDTINVIPGIYSLTDYIDLTLSGTETSTITYRKLGVGDAVFDINGLAISIIWLNAKHVKLDGLELTNSGHNGIYLTGDSCAVTNCYIHDNVWNGIRVVGDDNLILRNITTNSGIDGISISDSGENNNIYNNTAYNCTNDGINLESNVTTARIFNNITVSNNNGIFGRVENICGFNDVWSNSNANYSGGVVDSAGGISASPKFTNPPQENFRLKSSSPAIDAGLDLGYIFNGSTPDMGALETGNLASLTITPFYDSLFVDSSYQFNVEALDSNDFQTYPGVLTWSHTFSSGSIDSTGLFTSDQEGSGEIIVLSDINAITDTSETMNAVIPKLYIHAIPLGNTVVYSNQTNSSLLAFRIDNSLDTAKNIESVTVHDASRGAGNLAERLTNIDSLALYFDADNDTSITGIDSLIASESFTFDTLTLLFSPFSIPAESERSFIICPVISPNPHDSDSLDLFVLTDTDIQTSDGTMFQGPDTLNSQGYNIIDGLISEQISLIATGMTTISPGDSLYNIMIIDIPRNGYQEDTLNGFNVWNSGTADESDLDSMILFMDDGSNSWGGQAEEIRLGLLFFTGAYWSISGLNSPLTNQLTRYYVAVKLAAYPTNLSTVALGIPLHGLEMSSNNDGPLDVEIVPVDTVIIQTDEELAVSAVSIPARNIIPGESTGPILGLEFISSYAMSISIDSLSLNLLATDPDGASQSELDSQIDSMLLYANIDGDYTDLGLEDTLLSTAALSDGIIVFNTPGLSIPGSGSIIGISVVAALSAANAKNGNLINIGIPDTTGFFLTPQVNLADNFPLQNENDFVINAFPANNVAVNTISGSTFYGGQTDRLIFDFILPSNGYASDSLSSIQLINTGTFQDASTYLTLNLWADITGNGFTADDSEIGQFSFNAGIWTLASLAYPINTSGRRFFVTLDIANAQFEGGTIQLEVSVEGIEYRSGTTGADDENIGNPQPHLIFPSNRITVISVPEQSDTAAPGSSDNVMLAAALYNGYISDTQNLQAIQTNNISHSNAAQEYSDSELGQVSLFFDTNKNRIMDNDSLLATGYFNDGSLRFSGFNIAIPPESLFYFFMVADIPSNAIDSDSLAISISNPSDLTFSQSVNINGDLPVISGGYLIINGSVFSQYEEIELVSRTLSPGDTSVTLFAFRPASNGNLIDTLQSVTVGNIGDADTSDISSLEIWLDINGDDIWQNSDLFVSSFVYSGLTWTANSLEIEVDEQPPTLFLLADISSLASQDIYFQGTIPLNGCQFKSLNDGPLDNPLIGSATFNITNSEIRVSYRPLIQTRSIGQTIEVGLTVENISTEPMDSVYAQVISVNDSTIVVYDSSFSGPATLASGDSVEFLYYYTAIQTGEVYWRFRAMAPLIPDSSSIVRTNTVTLQDSPSDIYIQLISSIPTAVIRGQTNIFPFSMQYAHPDTENTAASLRLDSLQISIKNSNGEPLNADEVFSRMVLSAGYNNMVVLEDIPAQTTVPLVFSSPVIVPPSQQQLYTLLVDIDSQASASDFMLAIDNSSMIQIVDENSLQTVPLDTGVVFPMQTASCRIDDPSQQMAVSYTSMLNETVNFGQRYAKILRLRLRHPGITGNSQIQFTSLSFVLVDSLWNSINITSVLDEVAIGRGPFIIGLLNDFETDTSLQTIQLASPVTLNPGDTDTLEVMVSIKDETTYPGFNFVVHDSTYFEVRDLNSGSQLGVATDTLIISEGSAFPISSGWTEFRQPASAPEICLIPSLPSSIIGGIDSLSLIDFNVSYPSDSLHSPIRLYDIQITVLDSLGELLNPDRLFDKIGFRISDSPIEYQPFVPILYGSAVFNLSDTGLLINPSENLNIDLVADIEGDVSFDHFALVVQSENSIILRDAADTSIYPGISIANGCDIDFPFSTSITRIFLPAGRPNLKLQNPPLKIGFPGQDQLTIFEGIIVYDNPNPQGDLSIYGLRGHFKKRTLDGLSSVSGSDIFEAIYLMLDGQQVAFDSILTSDSLVIPIEDNYDVSWGSNIPITLKCDIKNESILGNYVIIFEDSTFLEMADKNLGDTIYTTLIEGSYPLQATEISISAANLERSFTNYPNPFHSSRGEKTIIGFVLAEDATIDITIFTITGDAVKDVTINSFRPAGSYQSDSWMGFNNSCLKVVSGTYFCRITAKYTSGREECFRRKIAVIR
ncbi:MAG: right-handed parallel beta-helix repeat-containing protein [candidate division Zixibacteria bacterium]|nr:right-handed parallel beta-helix repeat-containing protein [candidate division Zixibacteria bacterium]